VVSKSSRHVHLFMNGAPKTAMGFAIDLLSSRHFDVGIDQTGSPSVDSSPNMSANGR